MNPNNFQETTEQAAAFQKMWLEATSKMMQAAFTFTPNSAPPEVLRQMRAGLFRALAESWEQFMRSPQFLEGMRQWMENAITFRKLTNDFMARVRNEVQSPSREDVDAVMLAVRHIEKRLLDRLDEVSRKLDALNQPLAGKPRAKAPGKRAARAAGARKEAL